MTTFSLSLNVLSGLLIYSGVLAIARADDDGQNGSKRRQELIEMTLALNAQHFDAKANGEPYASLRRAVARCNELQGQEDPDSVCAQARSFSAACQGRRDDWDGRKATVLREAAAENMQQLIPALPRMELPPCATPDRAMGSPTEITAMAVNPAAGQESKRAIVADALPTRSNVVGSRYFQETIAKSERGESIGFQPLAASEDQGSNSQVTDVLLALAGGFLQAKATKGMNRPTVQALAQSTFVAPTSRISTGASVRVDASDTAPLNFHKGRRHSGAITEHCVTYRNLKLNDAGMQWFEFSNGCTETIQVWHTGNSQTYSNLSIIPALGKTSSWYSVNGPHAQKGIRYFACRQQEMGEPVNYDKQAQECYFILR